MLLQFQLIVKMAGPIYTYGIFTADISHSSKGREIKYRL